MRAQLTDVARPGDRPQVRLRRGVQHAFRAAVPLRELGQHVPGQELHIIAPIDQAGHAQHHGADAVEQIQAEFVLRDHVREVAVGARDQAEIDRDRTIAAHALHGALLQHAQQLGLRVERHVADLVEEDGAAFGLLEAAPAALAVSAGEGAGLVAEQFGLYEVGGQGRRVDRHQCASRPARQAMQRPRHQLLAGPARTGHQHRDVQRRHLGDVRPQLLHRRGLADHVVQRTIVTAQCLGFLPIERDLLLERVDPAMQGIHLGRPLEHDPAHRAHQHAVAIDRHARHHAFGPLHPLQLTESRAARSAGPCAAACSRSRRAPAARSPRRARARRTARAPAR